MVDGIDCYHVDDESKSLEATVEKLKHENMRLDKLNSELIMRLADLSLEMEVRGGWNK